jgi:TRAP-type C4-dicarboxylate transport system permease small subunit
MSANLERSGAGTHLSGGVALVDAVDHGIGRALELLCSALVVVETLILFVGVIARYVVHKPLVWSDELASTLFLWLGMLGAALAIRRSENLRMNTVVNLLPASLRALAEPFALAVMLAFVVVLLPAAVEHVKVEAIVITPTLEISSSWRAAAMPAALVLMALFLAVRVARQPLRPMLATLIVIVLACGILYLARPYLLGLGRFNLVVFFLGVVPVTVLAGVPIAFSFGGRNLCLPRAGYAPADLGRRSPPRSRHVEPHPAVDPSVRVPRLPARDHRHGRVHHPVPREPARARAQRLALRAGRGHVSRVGNLGIEGRGHGGGGAGAVSRDGEARRRPGGARGAARGDGRADRDRSAKPHSHRGRLGDRRLHRSAVPGRPAPCPGHRTHAVRAGLVPLSQRERLDVTQGSRPRDRARVRNRAPGPCCSRSSSAAR